MTYTVVGLLGRGGMAVVELAVDDHGRQVARKRLWLGGSVQQIAMARHRIRREVEVLTTLHHPGIVPLLGVEDDGTDVILVMPRMVGSLADRVTTSGPLASAEVIEIGRVLLDALASAHRQGVVHRDIKPANVLFDHAGHPALADFGVAIARQFTMGLTTADTIVGTPEFIAPEQACGKRAVPASDVFSLGATLAYALTGHGPFGQGDPAVLLNRAARGEVAPLPRSLPPGLRRALGAMLETRPHRRPTAAAALGGPTGTAVMPVRARRPSLPRRRKKTGLIALATIIAVVAAIAAFAGAHGPTRSGIVAAPPVPKAGPTTTACAPLPYQPCGQLAAPGTDGSRCLAGHGDYDGDVANGCEAVSDFRSGTILSAAQPVSANLVPADAVDSVQTHVTDSFLNFCLTQFRVTLTAPPGVTERVQILRGDKVLADAVSAGLQPATASAANPSCFRDDSGWLTITVSAVSGQSAEDFRLVRSGSW